MTRNRWWSNLGSKAKQIRLQVRRAQAPAKRRLWMEPLESRRLLSVFTESNSAAIAVPFGSPAVTNGPGSPYPSSISVSGLAGNIIETAITIESLTHTLPNDIDLLLQGPTGANLLLMSGAGGSLDVSNVTFTFDDDASGTLPTPLISGIFQPTNLIGLPVRNAFPAPAPVPSANTSLSVFDGTDPNGVWNLYVMDQQSGNFGIISGGWTLNLITDVLAYEALPGEQLVLRQNGTELEIYSDTQSVVVANQPLAEIREVRVEGSVTAGETLTIDYTFGGQFNLAGPITFEGGGNSGDALRIEGGVFTTITNDFTGMQDGTILLESVGPVTQEIVYAGLAPVLINVGSVADMVFNLPAGPNAGVVVGDDGTAADPDATQDASRSAISGPTFEYTEFLNPSGSLTINLGNGGDDITVRAMDAAFVATLNIVTGTGADTVRLDNGAVLTSVNANAGGVDTLDISALAGTNAIDLQAGLVSGPNTTFVGIDRFVGDNTGDQLIGGNLINTWNITGLNAGDVNGNVSFTGFPNLTGGSNADTFAISTGILTGIADGAGGNDTLNYSGTALPVTANLDLLNGTSTPGTAGIRGIENYAGSAVNENVLAAPIPGGIPRTFNGGGGANNVLTVDALGQSVTVSSTALTFTGALGPISVANWQVVNLVNVANVTVSGDGSNNLFVLSRSGAPGTPNAISVDGGPIVTIPTSSSLAINAAGGADRLVINETAFGLPSFGVNAVGFHSNASFAASGLAPGVIGLSFVGGGGDDSLEIHLLNQHDIAYFADILGAAKSGVVNVSGAFTLSFEELSPLVFTTLAAAGTLTVDGNTGVATTLTVSDDANPGDGVNQIVGNGGIETTSFAGFSSLVVRGGDGSQTVTLQPLDTIGPPTSITLSGDNITGTDTAADTLIIQAVPLGTSVSVVGGAGNDIISVGSATNNLATILGTVNVNGQVHMGAPSSTLSVTCGATTISNTLPVGDVLNINDQGAAGVLAYALNATSVTRTGSAAIFYAGIETLNLNAGSGADMIDVVTTADSVNTNIATTAGGDTVNVTTTGASSNVVITGDAAANAVTVTTTGASSILIVNAGGGGDVLTQVNSGANSGTQYNGAADPDTIRVQGSANGSLTVVTGGAGNDTINVGSAGNSLDPILGNVCVAGETHDLLPETKQEIACPLAGVTISNTLPVGDILNIHDQGDVSANTYTLDGTSLVRNIASTIYYQTIETLNLNAGSGADVIDVVTTADSVNTNIVTTAGGDTVNVATTGASSNVVITGDAAANAITVTTTGASSILIVNAGGGGDVLTQVNSGANSGTQYNGAADPDTIRVQGSANGSLTVVTGGVGNDTINVGSAGNSLDPILGNVCVAGEANDLLPETKQEIVCPLAGVTISNTLPVGDILNIHDQGDVSANTYTLDGTSLVRNVAPTIYYQMIETLNLNAGSGADVIDVVTTADSVNTNIATTGGGDTVNVTTTGASSNVVITGDAAANAVTVTTTGASSMLIVNAGGGGDVLTQANSGANSGTQYNGDSGEDIVNIERSAAGSLTVVNGGAGNDLVSVGTAAIPLDEIRGQVCVAGELHEDLPKIDPKIECPLAGVTISNPLSVGDTLTLNDQADVSGNIYTLDGLKLVRSPALPAIYYQTIETLNVNAGSGADLIDVTTTADSVNTNIATTAGGDTVNVTTTGVSSNVVITGDAAANAVTVTTTGAGSILIVNAGGGSDVLTQLANGDGSGTQYNGDADADAIHIRSTVSSSLTVVTGGAGNDTINVGSAGNSLDPILGNVCVAGEANDLLPETKQEIVCPLAGVTISNTLPEGDILNIHDQGDVSANTYTLDGTSLVRNVAPTIYYQTIETLNLNAGNGTDVIDVVTTADSVNTNIVTTAGGDTVNVTTTGEKSNVVITGDSAVNTIKVSMTGKESILIVNAGGGGEVLTQENSGEKSGTQYNGDADTDAINVQGSGKDSLTVVKGGTGSDTINVGDNIGTPASTLDNIAGTVCVDGEDNLALPDITQQIEWPATVIAVSNKLQVGDILNIDDRGDTSAHTYALDATLLSRTEAGPPITTVKIYYQTVETLNVNAGSGADVINVTTTADSVNTNIATTAGGDTVNVTTTGEKSNVVITGDSAVNTVKVSMTGKESILIVNAGGDGDVLTQEDNGEKSGTQYNGDGEDDTITIHATHAETTTKVSGDAGNDVILISPLGGNLDTIEGRVVIDGGGNRSDDAQKRYISTGGQVQTPAGEPLDGDAPCETTAEFVETVDLFDEGDTVKIFDNQYVDTGNTYEVASPAEGEMRLLITNSENDRPFDGGIFWKSVENLNLVAGMKNDMIVVQLPDPQFDLGIMTLDGGGPYANGSGVTEDNYVDIQGTAKSDAIVIDNIGGRSVTPKEGGSSVTIRSPFEVVNVDRLRAQGEGHDDVIFNKSTAKASLEGDDNFDNTKRGDIIVSGFLNGGTLDASAFPKPTIDGFVLGGAAGSFLVGGAGPDSLFGSGDDVTYLPDSKADAAGELTDASSPGDIVSFLSGSNAIIVSAEGDCLSTGCGGNAVVYGSAIAQVDVCTWLFASFKPLGGSGSPSASVPDNRRDALKTLVKPPLQSPGNPESPYQNPVNRLDVNDDGRISPLDALLIINELNSKGSRGEGESEQRRYWDVNGDNRLSPIDALLVINDLNRKSRGEGEGEMLDDTSGAGDSRLPGDNVFVEWSTDQIVQVLTPRKVQVAQHIESLRDLGQIPYGVLSEDSADRLVESLLRNPHPLNPDDEKDGFLIDELVDERTLTELADAMARRRSRWCLRD